MSHRKKPFSHKQKKKQLQAKRERQRDAAEREEKIARGEYVESNPRRKKETENPGKHRNAWVSNVTDDGNTLRTVFEKEPVSVIQARKQDAMQPIVRHKNSTVQRNYYYEVLEIPVRPSWVRGEGKEALQKKEEEAFNHYLRDIYNTHSREDLNMFEHNLEVWRQLWRVCEISDVLCVLADVRHPVFHFPPSLYRYVVNFHKKPLILVLTKADLVPSSVVDEWKDFFESNFPLIRVAAVNSFVRYRDDLTKAGVKKKTRLQMKANARYNGRWIDLLEIINSLVTELGAQPVPLPQDQIKEEEIKEEEDDEEEETDEEDEEEEEEGEEEEEEKPVKKQPKKKEEDVEEIPEAMKAHLEDYYEQQEKEEEKDEATNNTGLVLSTKRFEAKGYVTLGFIGSPNVGKSTLINALMGRKFCSESRTPGHTKHLQTLYLNPTLLLADCPGLVFPATKIPRELQVLCGIFPVAQCREPYSAIKFLCSKVVLEDVYALKKEEDTPWSAFDICDAYAQKRGFLTKAGRTNTHRAGIEILHHVIDGKIVWHFPPSDVGLDIEVYREGGTSKKLVEETTTTTTNIDESSSEEVEEVIEKAETSTNKGAGKKRTVEKKQEKKAEESEEESDEVGGGQYVNPFAVLGV